MFKDKTVWITGASSGIGRSLAIAFSEAGAKVIISARNTDKLNETKKLCQESENVFILPVDISKHDELPEKAAQAENFSGKIDILINNAGISQRGLAKDTGLDVDRKIIETNLLGTIALTKAVLPNMLERQFGHIVTITSVLGKFGAQTRSSYAASKHGLHGFFDSLRAEIYDKNIFITMICPGYVKTDVSINALEADGKPHNKLDQGQEKGLSPEECAKRIIAAISKRKNEAYIGGFECAGIYLKRFFPSIFEKVIRKINVN